MVRPERCRKVFQNCWDSKGEKLKHAEDNFSLLIFVIFWRIWVKNGMTDSYNITMKLSSALNFRDNDLIICKLIKCNILVETLFLKCYLSGAMRCTILIKIIWKFPFLKSEIVYCKCIFDGRCKKKGSVIRSIVLE